MHRDAVAEQGVVSLFLVGYVLIWRARGKQNPELAAGSSWLLFCCSSHGKSRASRLLFLLTIFLHLA